MLCINYCAPDMDYIDEAPQIKITYRAADPTLERFIEVHKDQTIYIDIGELDLFTDLDSLKRFQALKQYTNWILQVPVELITDKNLQVVDNIKWNALKDCCNKYMFTNKVGNWEVLQYLITLKPCEIYITNILGFYMAKLARVCGDIGIRVIANIAQSAWDGIQPLRKFFIRPEDLDAYKDYVSGIEFEGDSVIQEVLYKAYSRGYWYGPVNEIIIGFDDDVDSRQLPREFGEWRANCEKRCITGGHCNLCKAMRAFAERMDKTDTLIKPKVKDNL